MNTWTVDYILDGADQTSTVEAADTLSAVEAGQTLVASIDKATFVGVTLNTPSALAAGIAKLVSLGLTQDEAVAIASPSTTT